MKSAGVKAVIALIGIVFIFFFSNDFGLIDIEKTAIITAVAIDAEADGTYKVTAQIAVPEASDANTENMRAQISGTGSTVGAAIKNIGDVSGWYPQLAFCNLLIIGNSFKDVNLITVIDYFSKSLRIRDSVLIVMAEDKAAELLKLATPLDNISSFALQKILLKNAGLNRDVSVCDVKTFCESYYSDASSCFMPIVSVVSQKAENDGSSSGESGSGSTGSSSGGAPTGGAKGDVIFSANRTALFLRGVKVGELDEDLTFAFSAIRNDFSHSTFEVNGVEDGGETKNYLLTIFSGSINRYLSVTESGVTLEVSLNLFVRISDQNANESDADYAKNNVLPQALKVKAENDFKLKLDDLAETEIQTGCDFLGIKKELYRKHNSFYKLFENNLFGNLSYRTEVTIRGQQ